MGSRVPELCNIDCCFSANTGCFRGLELAIKQAVSSGIGPVFHNVERLLFICGEMSIQEPKRLAALGSSITMVRTFKNNRIGGFNVNF